jgi:phenylacetate-CoA ligase
VDGIVWPGVGTARGARLLALQWQLERTERWSAEALLQHQFRQIRALADHAVAQCSYYARHLQAAGLSSVGELTPETYLRWPRIGKRAVSANQAGLAAARLPDGHGAVAEVFTTGSTGEPTRVLHSETSSFFPEVLLVRDHLWHSRRFAEKFAAIRFHAEEGRQPGWSPTTAAAFATGEAVILSVTRDVGAQLDWLLREEPAYLLTTPRNLQALVLRSAETGRVPRRLREAITYAEMPPDGLREQVRRVWQVPLTDSYSCREIGPLALQCPEAGSYHVQAENVYLEILRPDGTPCHPGELGRVVVTPLHNFAMPLLRYELGDIAAPGGGCACGRGLPVLQAIAGRVRNMAHDPTGRWFQPALGRAIRSVPIRQFQALQTSLSRFEVRYVAEQELDEAQVQLLTAEMRRDLGYPFEIALTRVPSIERSPGGKFEDFICLLPDA